MKAYISGKITGDDENKCSEKFATAEYILKKKGYKEIYNPQKMVKLEPNLTPEEQWIAAMEICIPEACSSDTIYMIADWQNSDGARIEHAICKSMNKRIIYQEYTI